MSETREGLPEEFNNENITFQNVNDFKLTEVGEGEEADLEVFKTGEDDILSRAREDLKYHHWWLNEWWQQKGVPQEQFRFNISDQELDLYNFGESLTNKQESIFVDIFNKIVAKTRFGTQGLKYLLIDKQDREHSYDPGNKLRGEIKGNWQTLVLYPEGIKTSPYRNGEIGDFSELEGIIIHEIAHQFQEESAEGELLINLWNKQFAKFNEETNESEVLDPEKSVSRYARLNSSEDFAESVVAALLNPQRLAQNSPEKLTFLKRYLLREEEIPVSIRVSKLDRISLPQLPKEIRYKSKESEIKLSK